MDGVSSKLLCTKELEQGRTVEFYRTPENLIAASMKVSDCSETLILQGLPQRNFKDDRFIRFISRSNLSIHGNVLTIIPASSSDQKKQKESSSFLLLPPSSPIAGRLRSLSQDMGVLGKLHEPKIAHAISLQELKAIDRTGHLDYAYHEALTKLESFTTGIKSLDSQLIQREWGWKDLAINGVFSLLQTLSNVVGPISPIISGVNAAVMYMRNEEKKGEVSQAHRSLQPDMDPHQLNEQIAFQLTYMLQMQLPLCTKQGVCTILDQWLYLFFYSALKIEINEEVALGYAGIFWRLTQADLRKHITSKVMGTSIGTLDPALKWDTRELLKSENGYPLGVAYPVKDGIRYQSCGDCSKYGYLFCPDKKRAVECQAAITDILNQKKVGSIQWTQDETPKGPIGPSGNISPTILRHLSQPSTFKPGQITDNFMAIFESMQSEIEKLRAEVTDLRKQVTDLTHLSKKTRKETRSIKKQIEKKKD